MLCEAPTSGAFDCKTTNIALGVFDQKKKKQIPRALIGRIVGRGGGGGGGCGFGFTCEWANEDECE